MPGLKKLETAILHVGDFPPHKLEFEPVTMMRTTKQDGLIHELHSHLTILENRLHNVLRFGIAIFDGDIVRLVTMLAVGIQVLFVLPLTFGNQKVGRIENRLTGSIIFFQ